MVIPVPFQPVQCLVNKAGQVIGRQLEVGLVGGMTQGREAGFGEDGLTALLPQPLAPWVPGQGSDLASGCGGHGGQFEDFIHRCDISPGPQSQQSLPRFPAIAVAQPGPGPPPQAIAQPQDQPRRCQLPAQGLGPPVNGARGCDLLQLSPEQGIAKEVGQGGQGGSSLTNAALPSARS